MMRVIVSGGSILGPFFRESTNFQILNDHSWDFHSQILTSGYHGVPS